MADFQGLASEYMSLFPIILAVPPIVLGAIFLRIWQRRRRQIRFIRRTLAGRSNTLLARKVIAAFSTLPDRIANLEPTIHCLLNQTRPPDEIVIAVPHFSRRQQSHYTIPDYLEKLP